MMWPAIQVEQLRVLAGAADDDLGWLIDGWTRLAPVLVAVSVLVAGQLVLKRGVGARGSSPRRRLDFDLDVARMSSLPITPIHLLRAGPCHLEGEIRSATERLGGDQAGIVYVNRAGGGRDTAVSSTIVLIGDGTGQVALEHLDAARVIAAPEEGGAHERVCCASGIAWRSSETWSSRPRGPETPGPHRGASTVRSARLARFRSGSSRRRAPRRADPEADPEPSPEPPPSLLPTPHEHLSIHHPRPRHLHAPARPAGCKRRGPQTDRPRRPPASSPRAGPCAPPSPSRSPRPPSSTRPRGAPWRRRPGSLDQLQRLRTAWEGDEALAASAAVASREVIAHCAMLLRERDEPLDSDAASSASPPRTSPRPARSRRSTTSRG